MRLVANTSEVEHARVQTIESCNWFVHEPELIGTRIKISVVFYMWLVSTITKNGK